MDAPYIILKVVCGSNVVLDDIAMQIDNGSNFMKTFESIRLSSNLNLPQFKKNLTDSNLSRIFVSKVKNPNLDQQIEVLATHDVQKCCQQLGTFVRFVLEPTAPVEKHPKLDAFKMLMTCARELEYPTKYQESLSRKDYKLFNDLVDLMRSNGMGFLKGTADSTGRTVVQAISQALFYINPKPRQALLKKNTTFKDNKMFGKLLEVVYNDPTKHGHKLMPMSSVELDPIIHDLAAVLSLPVFNQDRMKLLYDCACSLQATMVGYRKHLCNNNEKMKIIHSMLQPARDPKTGDSTHLYSVAASVRSSKLVERYSHLEKALEAKDIFEHMFINNYAPEEPDDARTYFTELCLPYKVQLYKFNHGNYLGTLYFIWRLPDGELNMTASRRAINSVDELVPVYHTRQMRKEFFSRFSTVAKLSPAVSKEMYKFISGDASAANDYVSAQVQDRLKIVLDSQDPDIAFDLRHLNEGRPGKYDPFWDAVKRYMNDESLLAADERRHDSICHMALAMSVEDLIRVVKERNPDIEAPSASWTSLQFYPKNKRFHSAIHHTGKLEIKHMIQSRQVRHEHPDAHYCNAMFRYMREFAVQYRDICVFVSLDDKHNIQVGEPGYPVAAVERGRKVLVAANTTFAVGDHDFTKVKLVPSVCLKINIPDKSDESFYRGQVNVYFKEGALQPSSPLRHVAELITLLQGGMDGKHILALYTDGGPDHRLTYLAVKISLICLFRRFDIDYLIAVRTCPNQSFRNPVERIMSIINLALQGVGMMRSSMPEQFEKLMNSVSSLQDLRDQAAKDPQFGLALQDSMRGASHVLERLVHRLRLKDVPFTTGNPASEAEIEEAFNLIRVIDQSVVRGDRSATVIKNRPKLKEFLEHCCRSRHYFFCIKKCGKGDCTICGPIHMTEETWATLQWFPDPVLKPQSNHYKPFAEVFGTATTEAGRPSLVPTKPKPPFNVTKENARNFVECTGCGKPRVIHSRLKLTADQVDQVKQRKDDLYSCGQSFFDEDHPLHMTVIVPAVTCGTDVSALYFSSRAGFPEVCYKCGDTSDLVYGEFEAQSVNPVCSACSDRGVKCRTRGVKRKK